ncbi:caspase domain-containing protein [Mycena albidolilacea]|uniref:Caspase domain-containing protein n=1 Tax=Mycena albidolilacea TaxID=1033008 RepID=A0AAD6ZM99_9AGAR|nr:caspase domain-containing protein [Mycena albidolilacea]
MAISPKPLRGTRPTKKKALLIGIGYQDSAAQIKLDMPHEDVMRLRDFLIKAYGYRKENVTVMLDKPGELQPTQKNIRQQAANLVAGAAPGDHFFFYYAGHSVQIPEDCRPEERTELDGMDEAMVPSDGHTADHATTRESCLVDNELKRLLVNPLPAEASLMAVLDTCHSASLLDLDHNACNAKWSCLNTIQLKNIITVSVHNRDAPQSRPTPTHTTNKPDPRSSLSRKPELSAEAAASLNPCRMPLVISLAACKDDQINLENSGDINGRSFTERLLNILSDDPHPRLRDLMKKISISIHGMLLDAINVKEIERRQAAHDALVRKSTQAPSSVRCRDSLVGCADLRCQDPQMSSDIELNMESHLETL